MTATLILEISLPYLKMVLCRSALGTHYVKGAALSNITNLADDAVSGAVAAFLSDLKVKKPHDIVVCYSRNAVTLRNLRIPSAVPSEIESMIKLHIGRQVPYAKEEIVSGWRLMGQDAVGYTKVMLAIIHRESIRRILRILEKMGLYTDRIELSSDGVLSWLGRAVKSAELKAPEAFVILDIDASFTDFLVATHENVLFSRGIAVGRDQLNDEARWPKFIGELKQTLVISQGEEIIQKPSKIFVTGAVENLKNLCAKIEAEFHLPTHSVEPLANLPLSKEVFKNPAVLFEQASFTGLLGLGLDAGKNRIGFILPEAQLRRVLKERNREMIFLGSLIMYLILVGCGVYLERMHNRQAYLGLLKDRYQRIAVEADDIDEKLERLKRIKSKLDLKATAINYLLEVSKVLPGEIVLTQMVFQKDAKLDAKGRAREMSDVFNLITALENSAYFKDVQTRYTTRKKVKGRDINEFELVCPLEGTGQAKKAKKVLREGADETGS